MSCVSCGHPLAEVLDLGDHYLPDFTDPGTPPGKAWPLRLMMCDGCSLLQLADLTPRCELYHDRYGFRSGINEAIRADLADVVKHALGEVPRPSSWLDIASNDGTLLSFVPSHIQRTGIDPLAHLAAEAREHADRIIRSYFAPAFFSPGEFDVITSVSMFYDLADPGAFVAGVRDVLSPRGCWVIQQNYALAMLGRNAVDNICHEHVTYFSARSLADLLERHGMEINDVAYSDVNGGCFRVVASHRGARGVRSSVGAALAAEERAQAGQPETWRRWGLRVGAELGRTREFLEQAKARGERTFVYGASTRGGTILQMIGAGPDLLPFAVERSDAKVGKVMAATGIPIISEAQMRADPPEHLLVSPWFFRDVFLRRERSYLEGGGSMVFPLPAFEVVRA